MMRIMRIWSWISRCEGGLGLGLGERLCTLIDGFLEGGGPGVVLLGEFECS